MGVFITVEGVDGCGKSTLAKLLLTAFKDSPFEVLHTREPGDTPIGSSIRAILLNKENTAMTHWAEVFLFAADRHLHVSTVVKPALERGALVLCDRYVHSTLAYQGFGRGLPLEQLIEINDTATEQLRPDKVILLDLSPEEALQRAHARNVGGSTAEWTRFEQDTIDFHQRIRQGFLELAKRDPERFLIIDARRSPEEIAAEAVAAIRAIVTKKL